MRIPEPWVDQALCREVDPDLFYAEPYMENGGQLVASAKRVCRNCEVRVQCLEYALSIDEPHGIWGGTTPKERQRMIRRKQIAGRLEAIGWTPERQSPISTTYTPTDTGANPSRNT